MMQRRPLEQVLDVLMNGIRTACRDRTRFRVGWNAVSVDRVELGSEWMADLKTVNDALVMVTSGGAMRR